MSIFSKSIDSVTFDDIQRFCQERVAENVRIEYKRELSGKADTKQVAKEVSALANTQGGVILFGVDEDEEHKPVWPPTGTVIQPDPAERIKAICLGNIYPPIVPEVQSIKIDDFVDKVLVLVRVRESDETPHSINGRTEWYVRANDVSQPRPATQEELEWLLNRRQKAIEHRERLLERARLRRLSAPNYRNDRFLVTISIVPLYPREPLFELSALWPFVRELQFKPGWLLQEDNVKTAHESLVSWWSPDPSEPYTAQLDTFAFSQLDQFGLLYYTENAGEPAKDKFTKQSHEAMQEIPFLATLYRMLITAVDVYRKGNYGGLVQIRVEFENALRKGLFGVDAHQMVRIYGLSPDAIIPIQRSEPVSRLADATDEITMNIYKELRWAFGARACYEL